MNMFVTSCLIILSGTVSLTCLKSTIYLIIIDSYYHKRYEGGFNKYQIFLRRVYLIVNSFKTDNSD